MNLRPVSSATHTGLRYYQEDRFVTLTCEQGTLLAVFDGHGGEYVSNLVSEELPDIFAFEIAKPKATPRKALKNIIRKLNLLTQQMQPGSTASLAFIPAKGSFVTCAVIGDSPIIIKDSKGNINISPDHNVRTNHAEAKAAQERGGFISQGYLMASFNGPGLQMARALGDASLNRVLSRKPDIYSVRVNRNSFVLVATDGLFDPGHYDFKQASGEVVKLVDEGADAKALVDDAIRRRTGDNVTAILGRFNE